MSMTDAQVLAALAAHADPVALSSFQQLQMRYEVTNGTLPTDRVLYAPVACPDGKYMAASFTLEKDADDDGRWATVWHAVQGPMTRQELQELASA